MRGTFVVQIAVCLLAACTACTAGTAGTAGPAAPPPGSAPAEPIPGAVASAVAGVAGSPAPALPSLRRDAAGVWPPTLAWGGHELLQNGTGLCEWGIFGIDLYEAALYLERRAATCAAALDPDQCYVLHLHFVRSLSAAQLGEAFTASVRTNCGDRAAAFAAPLGQLVAAMRDVGDGDAYTFCGDPGHGLTIQRDGEAVQIGDEAFRRLFLQLYLGEHPPTTALRAALLGRR